jgi:hypothetical protein
MDDYSLKYSGLLANLCETRGPEEARDAITHGVRVATTSNRTAVGSQ